MSGEHGKHSSDLAKEIRLPKGAKGEAVIDEEKEALIFETAERGREILPKHFIPEFGVTPATDSKANYSDQVWLRDAAHAIGNTPEDIKAAKTSLTKIFEHQREDGGLPLRVERKYMMIALAPGLEGLAKPLFNLVEGKIRGRKERPVYEGQDFSGAEDTVPVAIIAAGEFFINGGEEGKEFFESHYKQIFKAIDFFYKKTDEEDGLAQTGELSPDWEDSINRPGKLGGINVYWARALRLMEYMSTVTGLSKKADAEAAEKEGRREEAKRLFEEAKKRVQAAGLYKEMYSKVNKSIREKLYDKDTGCIKSSTDDDRIDTVASIYAGLYLFTPSEAAKMEETFKEKLTSPSGFLLNHDRPYPRSEKQLMHNFIGHTGYHDKYVWPWVSCQNIQVNIKIATDKTIDKDVREKNKEEAVRVLLLAAENFKNNKGAYEILHPDSGKPAITRGYVPPKDFMANWATYLSAYEQMIKLGWIKK